MKQSNVEVLSTHSHGPSRSFSWPREEYIRWVPLDRILGLTDAPGTTRGRHYAVPDANQRLTKDQLNKMEGGRILLDVGPGDEAAGFGGDEHGALYRRVPPDLPHHLRHLSLHLFGQGVYLHTHVNTHD